MDAKKKNMTQKGFELCAPAWQTDIISIIPRGPQIIISCKSKAIQFATVSFLSEWNESASRSGYDQLLGPFINHD